MIINDVNEIKALIKNNVELCRLHDFIRGNQGDPNVIAVTNASNFYANRMVWYTLINSLFSSISLVYEYMLKQGDDRNQLDNQFCFQSWNIVDCYEFDSAGTRCANPIDLDRVLRRVRNSVSHGLFSVNTQFDSALNYELIFEDKNIRYPNNPDSNFILKMKAIKLDDFLQKIEHGFNTFYP